MAPDDFGALIGAPTQEKADFFGVQLRTLRAWCEGTTTPPAGMARLAALRYGGDLSALFGNDWRDITASPAGLLLPGWRYPAPVAELRQIFARTQLENAYQRQIAQLEADLDKQKAATEAAEHRAAYYRGLVTSESRAAWLQRITSGA